MHVVFSADGSVEDGGFVAEYLVVSGAAGALDVAHLYQLTPSEEALLELGRTTHQPETEEQARARTHARTKHRDPATPNRVAGAESIPHVCADSGTDTHANVVGSEPARVKSDDADRACAVGPNECANTAYRHDAKRADIVWPAGDGRCRGVRRVGACNGGLWG